MKSIRFRFLVAALALSLAAVVANAQTATDAPPPPRMHYAHEFGMGEHMLGFFADYLNLTDAQQTQMKSILQKERPTLKPLFQQSRQIEMQLHQLAEGTYDEAKVRALATQKAQVDVELTVQKTRIHNELFQVLTPDQQTKMKDFLARRQARMQKHMQQDAPPAPSQD